MYKRIIAILLNILFGLCLFLICIMPTQLYKLQISSLWGDIFPAIDIIIIYYFCSYKSINSFILFLISIIIDQIYHNPIGTNFLGFIIANFALLYASKWFVLKEEITNLSMFAGYSLIIIFFRYMVFAINYKYSSIGISIFFYYFTTIASYPLFRMALNFCNGMDKEKSYGEFISGS